jgi:3-phenylpropionate/trans-cinnamate dioxygenase ferredoxin subunit
MPSWIKIAETGEIAPGAGRAFEVEGYSFNVDGKLYAIDDSCPHQGSSLAMGSLEGCTVTCRSHGMKVNVTGWQQPSPGMTTPPMATHDEFLRTVKAWIEAGAPCPAK